MPRKATSRNSSTRKPIDQTKLSYIWRRAKYRRNTNASSETVPRALRTNKNATFDDRIRKIKKKSKKYSNYDSEPEPD